MASLARIHQECIGRQQIAAQRRDTEPPTHHKNPLLGRKRQNFMSDGDDDKPRILVLADLRIPSEKAHPLHLVKMCEAFAATGADVELVYSHRRQDPRLAGVSIYDYYNVPETFAVREIRGFDVVPLELVAPRLVPPVFAARATAWGMYAATVARRSRPDLCFTTNHEVAYWCALLGVPTFWEAHKVPRRTGRWFLRHLARQAAFRGAAALTSVLRDELLEFGFDPEHVIVRGEGVDLDAFDGLRSREECRREVGLPLDRPIIGFIGRFLTLGEEKGIPELVRAMAIVPKIRGREPLLVCVGGPMSAVDSYRRIAADAGTPEHRLLFVDHVSSTDVPTWTRALDVGASLLPDLPHYALYASSMKLFEYMAGEAAVLASDLPATRDVVRHGENGWLVAPTDVVGAAHAITTLLHDDKVRARLVTRAAADVRESGWTERARTIRAAAGVSRSDPTALPL
jgi:glycosyltransferase involved in cell wall biosynthesis